MTKKKQKTEPELPFTSPEFVEIWDLYLKHRKEKGASNYTETGLNMFFKKIIKLSVGIEITAIKLLEQSIENNWTGIFPLKQENNANINRNGRSISIQPKDVDLNQSWR